MKAESRSFVSFKLDEQRYALPCMNVNRILRALEITPLPEEKEKLSGIINLHGNIVPVINIRKQLGLSPRKISLDDQIVIFKNNNKEWAFVVNETNFIEVNENMLVPIEEGVIDSNGSKFNSNKNSEVISKSDEMNILSMIIKDLNGPIYILKTQALTPST